MSLLLRACVFFILDICIHIAIIGLLWIERVFINWLFDVDYVEKIKEWIKSDGKENK